MSIVYITGNAASGKTTALNAISRSLHDKRKPYVHALGHSTPKGIAQEIDGRSGVTLLVDDCSAELLRWLETPGNLPRDGRVFVTMHQLPRK